MSYIVRGVDLTQIKLAPATVEEDVLQNVAVILSTLRGSCPLAREIGLKGEFVDKPMPVARTLLIADIMESVSSQEPRAAVLGVTFEGDADTPAKLIPVVEVDIVG
jgi:phage baseplate assembly protein W